MTEEEYNEKLNMMDKCVEYWKQKADRLDKKISNLKVTYRKQRNKEIDKLQKENAELKEKLGDVQMQKAGEKSDLVWKLKIANEQKAEQLTKAKEIIKNLMVYVPVDLKEYEEAKQFTSEVINALS